MTSSGIEPVCSVSTARPPTPDRYGKCRLEQEMRERKGCFFVELSNPFARCLAFQTRRTHWWRSAVSLTARFVASVVWLSGTACFVPGSGDVALWRRSLLARVAPHSFEPLLSQSPPLVPPIPQSPDSVVMIQDCYSVRKGNVCVVCSQPIQTPGVKIGASLYHMECFQCSRCRSSIGANAGMCRACAVRVPCVCRVWCAVLVFHP